MTEDVVEEQSRIRIGELCFLISWMILDTAYWPPTLAPRPCLKAPVIWQLEFSTGQNLQVGRSL